MENYQFIRQIAQGNFSEVWLVKCSKTRRKFVLKQIDVNHLPKREQRAAYLDAKLLSTVKHPHIASYLDSFYNSKGNLFIIMCFFENGDLRSFIRNQNDVHLEEKQIVHWFVQMCMALKYLHDKKILHRDLKTRNIFLTKNNLIKISDFGISRAVKVSEELAKTLVGIPCYLSPETYLGKNFSEKSDVWALGCCIYEIAALKNAFDIQSLLLLKKKSVKAKLALISDIYSATLCEIISLMLSLDPENRPNVTELLLNDYIRKHIVIFLQDTPRSSSSNSNILKPEETQDVRCKYYLLPFINKEGDIIEHLNNTDSISIKTIPDINGNGDGNDNSQQRANTTSAKKANNNNNYAVCKTSSASSSVESDISAHFANYRHQDNENLRNLNFQSINSGGSSCLAQTAKQKLFEKQKSEYSFKILNNLSYTLRNSRIRANEKQASQISSTKAKYLYDEKSPRSCQSEAKTPFMKLQSATAVTNHLQDFSESYNKSLLTLPHISFDNHMKKVHQTSSEEDTKNFNLFEGLEFFQHKNKKKLPEKDSVNDVLIHKRMESNKLNTSSKIHLNQ